MNPKKLSESFTSFFSVPTQLGGSGRLSISRIAAYCSIKLASKSAKPLHSSLFQSAIMVYLLFFTAT
ncbi:MAG: hypothetical protein ACI317_07445, partial [Floccifex porci]|uniref:hypothetical protein n=1 Tax=Floccifex porci TaxID=2606629 RepID=UPI003F0D894A